MNVKQAKALRKAIYGDMALRDTQYECVRRSGRKCNTMQVVSTGLRRAYQVAKRQMLANKRG